MSDSSKTDLSDLHEVGHSVYVLAYDSGTVKVGYTAKPRQRIQRLDLAARQMGTSIVHRWVSAPHSHARKSESALVAFCAGKGQRVTGGLSGEYFTGIQFDDVRDFARSLPVENRETLSSQASAELDCRACAKVDKRIAQALSVMFQLDLGELRLVDARGMDVTAAWTTGMVHSCPPDAFPPLQITPGW